MNRRTFRMQTRLTSAGSGLIDIPHMSVLRYRSPQEIIRSFEEIWGTRPDGVVLPVTSSDGLLFEVQGVGLPVSPYVRVSGSIVDYHEVVQEFSRLGVDIYLLIDPTLHFCRTDNLHIIDIAGDGSASVCIGNPRSQELLATLLGTAIDEVRITTENSEGKLKGVAIDVVDLWPMGASNQRLELTCFCPSCQRYFEDRKPGLLRHFRTFPNPWNLLLKDVGTGIANIDDISASSQPDDIVGFSRQKAFSDVFRDAADAELLEQARHLLDYIRLRHGQTLASVQEVFQQSLDGIDQPVERIILTEGGRYGWTSGLLLDELDKPDHGGFDEVWFDPRSSDTYLRHVAFRSYMWRRSRYRIDAFLSFAANVSDPVARSTTGIAKLSSEFANEMLRSRLNQALGSALTDRSALASLPELAGSSDSKRIGFVGVALDRDTGMKMIDSLRIPEGIKESSSEDPASVIEDLLRSVRSGKE